MHTENDPETTPVARTILMLLGSYAFGFNLHNIIHELGHAVAIWLQGGSVPGFYLHPFDSCLTYGTYVPNHILLYAGGAFIGGASTLLFPVLAWKIRRPLVLLLGCPSPLPGSTQVHRCRHTTPVHVRSEGPRPAVRSGLCLA